MSKWFDVNVWISIIDIIGNKSKCNYILEVKDYCLNICNSLI